MLLDNTFHPSQTPPSQFFLQVECKTSDNSLVLSDQGEGPETIPPPSTLLFSNLGALHGTATVHIPASEPPEEELLECEPLLKPVFLDLSK